MFGGQNACFISEYYHYQYVSKTLNRVWLGFSNLPTPGPSQEGSQRAQIPIPPLDLPIQREHLRSTDYVITLIRYSLFS